jgi:glycosyltransferase involved in cell wall biosynthesis
MKIIYLHQYFNTPTMVGSTRSYEMARRLVAYGHEVHMITSWREDDGRKNWFKTEENGINVHWLPVPYSNEMGFYERIKAFVKFALGSAKKAIELKGDIVFATSTPLTIAVPGIIASKINRIPMVFEVRDLWPEVPVALGILRNKLAIIAARWLAKIAYKNSRHIVALAPGMKDEIEKVSPNAEVSVVPNGCDIELFGRFVSDIQLTAVYPWLKDKSVVLYPGTIGKVNNVEYLVEIAKELISVRSDIVFVVIGDGNRKADVSKMAEDFEVMNKNFFMLNSMSKNEIVLWFQFAEIITVFYKAPDCAVKNSVQNKFFDALSAGKPVLFEHRGWSVELLNKQGGAVYIPSDSPLQAAEILAKSLEDSSWLEKAGKASLKLAKERFDRNLLAKQLEKVLLNAIKGRNQSFK